MIPWLITACVYAPLTAWLCHAMWVARDPISKAVYEMRNPTLDPAATIDFVPSDDIAGLY